MMITIARAAEIARKTKPTMTRWARVYGLGRKIGGMFYIDEEKLKEFLGEGYIEEEK